MVSAVTGGIAAMIVARVRCTTFKLVSCSSSSPLFPGSRSLLFQSSQRHSPMEKREDLASIIPFLPLSLRSSSLVWPPKALEALKAMALGPDVSRVDSGKVFFDAIIDLRCSLGLAGDKLARRAADGYSRFFDELMSKMDSGVWFRDVIPTMADLLLRLPSLLEAHYQNADKVFGEGKAGLRLMGPQDAGIMFLSQELIAALFSCALLCLFPTKGRKARRLPTINFDHLFAELYPNTEQFQEQKVRCLVHYLERISLCMPPGFVSFERKVLPLQHSDDIISYPEAAFWGKSTVPLCSFKVFSPGLIEDQQHEALEVDFADAYLGGLALKKGCVQEEIRFMINPELIVGMLFMSSMEDNEAIEIVGVERFSKYTGYRSSFRFAGDYVDKRPSDSIGRRKTRVVAIDALRRAKVKQYKVECLVRETNKAFCGFIDQSKHQCYLELFLDADSCRNHNDQNNEVSSTTSNVSLERIGIATGNWGCGVFGGDPEVKSIIQWLAASQALRPFIHYYTFEAPALRRLEDVTQWILLRGWTVGDLWSKLVEYASQKLGRKIKVGFFTWLLPENSPTSDVQHTSQESCSFNRRKRARSKLG